MTAILCRWINEEVGLSALAGQPLSLSLALPRALSLLCRFYSGREIERERDREREE